MDTLLLDLRYGLRTLCARPGFTAVAVVTLALGVGANTAVFSAVNALLLRPLPLEDEGRLVAGVTLRQGVDPFGTSFLDYELYSREARTLASTGLATQQQFNLVGDGEPERLVGALMTASYLSTLGVKPALGRVFSADEDRPGGPAVALVSYALWRRRFGGDPAALGSNLDLEGRRVTVIGVMPPGFDIPFAAEVWLPMQISAGALPFDQKITFTNNFVARLRPGVTIEQADVELKALARRLEEEHPQIRRSWSYGVFPLRRALLADLRGEVRRPLLMLALGVAFLLLICCANVAGLLLARAASREGEIAIRRSLGAGRARLVRQLLTESLLLATLGGSAGMLLAYWMRPALVALNPIQAAGLVLYFNDLQVDGRVLAFSLCVTLLSGVAFGLAPALAASSEGLMTVLKRHEQRTGAGTAARRWLAFLVIGEMAIAATLLAGGALVIQSFRRLSAIDLGFRPDGLINLELPLSPAKYQTRRSQVQFLENVLERARALPGAASAGVSTNIPMQRGPTLASVFEVEGRKPVDQSQVPVTAHRMVTAGYAETLGLTLLKGRFFEPGDREGSLPVAVVSEELARQAWPGEDPIGKRVRRMRGSVAGPWLTVVGLVKDVKEDRFNFRIARPVWYIPYSQEVFPLAVQLPMNLLVRTTGESAALIPQIREAVRSIDPDQPVANVMPVREQLADLLLSDRFGAVLMAALAAVGLLLAALGLYGVMAYSVSQRVGEIGLRMALGAKSRDVLQLIVGQGVRLVAAGLILGVLGGWIVSRLLASRLYELDASDPRTFAAVGVLLAVVALLACWLPARRATRIDPMSALRSE